MITLPSNRLVKVFCKYLLMLMSIALMLACEPKEEAAKNYFDSGLSYYEKGELEKARIEFLNTIQVDAQHGQAYYYLALIAKTNGDLPLVFEYMRLAMHLDRSNIDAKINVAELLVFGQKFDEALTIVESILTVDRNNYQGIRLKAATMVGLEKYDEALELLEKAKNINDKDASVYGLNAIIANEQGDTDASLGYLEKALELGGKNRVQYLLLRTSINQKKKNYAALEQDYLELINEQPDEREYVFALAKIYVAKKQIEDAEKLLNRYVFSHTQDTKAKKVLLDILNISDPQRAANTLNSMLEEQPGNFELRYYKVNQALQKNDIDSAKGQLKDIIDSEAFSEKETLKARAMLAEILFKQNDTPGALALINKNLSITSDHEESHLLLAHYELGKKSYEMAGRSLRVVLKNNPESEKALVLLGRMYTLSGSDLLADDSFRQALDLNPANIGAALPVAKKLLKNQDLERSDNVISSVLRKKPLDKELISFLIEIKLMKSAWREAELLNQRLHHLGAISDYEYFLGRIYLGRKQYENAIKHFKQSIDLDPSREQALQGLSAASLQLKKEQELLAYLDQYTKIHPNYLHGYIVSAQVYQHTKKLDKAIDMVELALQQDPSWVAGYIMLANYKLALRDSQGVIDVYKQAIKKHPGQERFKILLASYYESVEDYIEAEKTYQNALRHHPDNKIALNNYVSMLLDKLDTPANNRKALTLAEGLKGEKSAIFIDTYAWAKIKNGHYVEGEKYARIALDLAPSQAEIQYHLAIALKGLNRIQEAKNLFKRAKRHVEGKEKLAQLIEIELKSL